MHMGDTKTCNGLHNSVLDELAGDVSPRSRDFALDPALQLLDLGGAPSASDPEPSLQSQHSTHEENLRHLDPSLAFALEAYPDHAFEVSFVDDIRFWVDHDGPARAPDSQTPCTPPSASPSPSLHQHFIAGESTTGSEASLGLASSSSRPVPTPRARRKRTHVVDTDHPRATPGPHPVVESTLLSPALDLESIKAPLFAPQRPTKKKPRRAHGPTPGIAKRTRHDGTLVPAYPCARCVEKDLECRICYVGGACNVCRAVARKCDLVNQENKYNSWVDSCRTHKKGGKV